MRTNLMIDRYTATIGIPREYHESVKRNLDELSDWGRIVKINDRYSKFLKGYKYAYKYMFDEFCFCAIQIESRKNHRYMRLDWNPSRAKKICPNPTAGIIELLIDAIPSFSLDLMREANITRIDFAFDVPNLPVDAVFAFSDLRNPLSERYFTRLANYGRMGYLNSQSIGKDSGDQYLLIYDKTLEEKNRQIGRSPMLRRHRFGRELQEIHYPKTRFELRLRDVGTANDLLDRTNPFSRYTVINAASGYNFVNDYVWHFFIAACHMHGAQAALSMIRKKKDRDVFSNFLREAGAPTWWNPEALWAEAPRAISEVFPMIFPH